MIPGEIFVKAGDIICNEGRQTTTVTATNTGDRPIQVGSHFHFFEVNKAMSFNRGDAFGMRLNIPAGTAVRFEPGEEKEIELVDLGGNRRVIGLNNLVNGDTTLVSNKTDVFGGRLRVPDGAVSSEQSGVLEPVISGEKIPSAEINNSENTHADTSSTEVNKRNALAKAKTLNFK